MKIRKIIMPDGTSFDAKPDYVPSRVQCMVCEKVIESELISIGATHKDGNVFQASACKDCIAIIEKYVNLMGFVQPDGSVLI